MRKEPVFFPSGGLTLHGFCYYPEVEGILPGVVLCHPHPLNGGSMSSSVIRALGQELAEKSIVAFMFDFRGVGRSQGIFDNGIGEQDDAEAALKWLENQPMVDKSKIGLAGYSFGGGVAAMVASKNNTVKALALISPYLQPVNINCLKASKIQKYFITGGDDDLITAEDVDAFYKASADSKKMEIIPDVDHFWFGSEKMLGRKVADFMSGAIK